MGLLFVAGKEASLPLEAVTWGELLCSVSKTTRDCKRNKGSGGVGRLRTRPPSFPLCGLPTCG